MPLPEPISPYRVSGLVHWPIPAVGSGAQKGVSEMAKAIWNGKVIADSDTFEEVEGNIYFPQTTLRREFLRESATRTHCSWKGEAHYYDLLVDGEPNRDAAWFYPDPKPAAAHIKDHIAFWRGVRVER